MGEQQSCSRLGRLLRAGWSIPMNRLSQYHPASLALYGYASYVVLGWILLLSPWALDKAVGALDTLFIAMSAVSTTGLCPLSVADTYSFFGELVVLALIQVGGIGYMTFGSFVILARSRSLSPIRTEIGKTVFSLPASLDITVFLRRVIQFTLVFETLGTLALYPIFLRAGDPEALWSAVFHSVTAFCNLLLNRIKFPVLPCNPLGHFESRTMKENIDKHTCPS